LTGSEAVLPAYVAGLAVAGVFLHDRVLMDRLRSIAFALLTPGINLRRAGRAAAAGGVAREPCGDDRGWGRRAGRAA
jgi:hypothetical protein